MFRWEWCVPVARSNKSTPLVEAATKRVLDIRQVFEDTFR